MRVVTHPRLVFPGDPGGTGNFLVPLGDLDPRGDVAPIVFKSLGEPAAAAAATSRVDVLFPLPSSPPVNSAIAEEAAGPPSWFTEMPSYHGYPMLRPQAFAEILYNI
jgi:hypothetical protein